MIGSVKKWVSERGFGFIAPEAGGADVFVHVTALGSLDQLSVGDRVSFDEEIDPRSGKTRAVNVRVVEHALLC